ncbi:sugar ABC transporter permease [Bradyrhizobium sp. 151]|uniref:carbohydrate ABC transporter permease n=1 Tax=Bradyrhizobium sp. 151 TaxID=2782626 RepID=UPI001FF816B9|nr:sugar ABC transporter permease [Bradyrhizobium sp. 151]MCK1656722.1 sugar ABC transporter permease [Bradyrhizobium sp. 151]
MMTLSASLKGAEQRRPSRLGRMLEDRLPYLIVAPAILILLLVGLFPLIYSLIVSFQRITMTENDTSFVGLLNYAELFRDARLWASLGHTAIITAIALPLELLIGFLMAQLFIDRMPGRQLFVVLLVLPTVISPIVAGATWRLMFDVRFGPVGQILSFIAGEPVRILWTVNPAYVYPAIIVCEVWQWSPFMFLLLLAALSNVDQSQLEAAELDGASYFRVLRAIVLPAIAPVVAVACLIRGLDLVRIFDIIWALTEGGPGSMTETISLYTYVQGFSQFETSYTAAISFLVIALLTLVTTLVLKRMVLAR